MCTEKYLNKNLPVEIRIKDLLSRMTLDEKLEQMSLCDSKSLMKDEDFCEDLAQKVMKNGSIGAIIDPRLLPDKSTVIVNKIQDYIKNNSRFGIPALIVTECLHGHMGAEATIFPQSIALASTWDKELVKEIASVIAKEASSVGVRQGLAPDLDLAREPRWGRVEETYGEDPYLCEKMGVSYVKGLQGEDGMIDNEHIVATLKHFAAHGSPEGGVNLSPVPVGKRQLRELYLPPFEAAIKDGGALSVMNAYSEVDGIPCAASKQLLNDILRKEWGFIGYIIADFGSIEMLNTFHKTAETLQEAGKQAIEAGIDIEAPEEKCYGEKLKQLITKGKISEKLVDRAVECILRVKFLTGLFDDTYVDSDRAKKIVNCKEHRVLARKAAQESIILLENKNNILPLNTQMKSLAVIGPNADVVQLGDYTMDKDSVVSPIEGIKNIVSSNTKVIYAKGCGIYEQSKDGFEEAINTAKLAEVAVVCVGGTSMVNCGIGWENAGKSFKNNFATCGEGFDRTDLELPGVQQQLVEEIIKTGTPTIVVLINGRPYSTTWISENANGLIEAWYIGEEGGNALADVIFGKVNPSGKLPISIPKTVGQVPIYYNSKPSSRGFYKQPGSLQKPGRDYVFMNTKPLYEFGYGLSYTKFEYSNLTVFPVQAKSNESITVTVKVKNIGNCTGKEVVQMYINDVYSSVTTPVKALKGFEKIKLKPNEEKEVSFIITERELALYDVNMNLIVQPGEFEIMIGNLKTKFKISN